MSLCRPAGFSDDENDDSDDCMPYVQTPIVPAVSEQYNNEIYLRDAVIAGDLKKVEDLIPVVSELNTDINTKLNIGWPLLLYACFHGQPKIVQMLLERGADPNLHSDSMTPLMMTCSNTVADNENIIFIVKSLLEKGAILNIGDKHGQTPLMRAIVSGRIPVVKELLEYKVNIEMRDRNGWTALFWSVHHKQPEIVEMLIAHGARVTEVDRSCRTVLEIAETHENDEIVNILKKHLKIDEDSENLDCTDYINKLTSWLDFYPGVEEDKKPNYQNEIPALLYGMKCERLVPLFEKSGMDLRSFLLMEDDDMMKLGIEMPYERQRLKHGLKSFHLRSWKLNAVPGLYVKKTDDYSALECLTTLGTHLQQIYILEATLQYVLRNYSYSIKNQIMFEPLLNDKINGAAENIVHKINSMRRELEIMKKNMRQKSLKNLRPVDIIRERRTSETILGYATEGLKLLSLGLLIYNAKNIFKFFCSK